MSVFILSTQVAKNLFADLSRLVTIKDLSCRGASLLQNYSAYCAVAIPESTRAFSPMPFGHAHPLHLDSFMSPLYSTVCCSWLGER